MRFTHLAVAAGTCVLALAIATPIMTRPPDRAGLQTRIAGPARQPLLTTVLPDTFVLAEYDFDDGMGGPDPQGWVSVDRTAQDVYFHVDDFSGAGAPYAPLEGAQSLWCGAETFPGCQTCPGYGNTWAQYFESVAFPSSGEVTVVTGRQVATLVDGYRPAGESSVSWHGRNDDGAEVATGVYFYRMTTAGYSLTRKMVLLK